MWGWQMAVVASDLASRGAILNLLLAVLGLRPPGWISAPLGGWGNCWRFVVGRLVLRAGLLSKVLMACDSLQLSGRLHDQRPLRLVAPMLSTGFSENKRGV